MNRSIHSNDFVTNNLRRKLGCCLSVSFVIILMISFVFEKVSIVLILWSN